ncbi:MAG: amidohydrolase family protein [Gammaproteobacteria bacterium]|nr:amidohydrolase family protein [Gammaproteobacteria bacterium]
MRYDLLIKNGTVIDGSGMPRFRADVGVKDGKIASIGRINALADEVIDAEGHVVAPGFVDGHTHMDAQIFWDPIGTSSCYHGVTSVIMGNCGFTIAPCRESEADLVFRNLERAEDISREAMLAGIKWQWETFPEYLDVLESLPKGINYGGYMGHSALRTYVMGERAFTEEATEDDVRRMVREVKDSVRAGAIGFSTSRSRNHQTADDRPVASRAASWDELTALVRAMGEMNAGILEIAGDPTGHDRERADPYFNSLKDLSVETGRPVTFGMFSIRQRPDAWRPQFEVAERAAAEGGRMFIQVHSRALNVLLSFETNLPYDTWDMWSDIRALPLAEQKHKLTDPEIRRRLVEIANTPYQGPPVRGAEPRPPNWDWTFVMDKVGLPHRSMAEVAAERGIDPVELMIDLGLEHDFKIFFRQPIANELEDQALALMKEPRSVVTFSDSGAHVTQIMDSSLQTHIFDYWVREKQAFTLEEAVRLVTFDTATNWGLYDRGLLREGFCADIVVFDPDTIGPRMPEVVTDLPAGAKRLKQTANGILATVVNGQVLLKNNEHTGAVPGQLLRGPLASH